MTKTTQGTIFCKCSNCNNLIYAEIEEHEEVECENCNTDRYLEDVAIGMRFNISPYTEDNELQEWCDDNGYDNKIVSCVDAENGYVWTDECPCVIQSQDLLPPSSYPTVSFEQSTFPEVAMKLLKDRFPSAKIVDENFNHNFSIYFEDGKFGCCGLANGDFECDVYVNEEASLNGEQADGGHFIAFVKHEDVA